MHMPRVIITNLNWQGVLILLKDYLATSFKGITSLNPLTACTMANGMKVDGTASGGEKAGCRPGFTVTGFTCRWAHAKMGAYVGQWSAGLFHGKGSYKYPDGEKFEGSFQLSCPVSGIVEKPNGTRAEVIFDGSSKKGFMECCLCFSC